MSSLLRRNLNNSMSAEKDLFLSFLRAGGKRVTAERLAVFDEIFSRHGHPDADGIYRSLLARAVPIGRATVYRNLELLVDCGLVRKYRLGRRRFLYEHIHPGQQHDHLVCRDCGQVTEFVSPGIRALQREICRAHGFVPDDHTLQISGLCDVCAGRPPAARPADGEAAHAS